MHSGPRESVHGNWIWLPTAAFSAALIAAVVVSYGGGGCPRRAAGSTPGTPRPAASPSSGARPGVRAASASPGGTPRSAPAHAVDGLALYYDPGGAVGSCLMGPLQAGGLYVSLSPQQYDGGAACGTFLDVRGPDGTVRAEVVDLCPGCAAGTINLSRAAFDRIANPMPGSARVSYSRPANPPLRHRIELRVAGGPAEGGVSVQVLYHGNPLTSVAVAPAAAASAAADPAGPSAGAGSGAERRWQPLSLEPNGSWASTQALAAGPLDMRVVDQYGHQVVLTRLTLRPGAVIRSRDWMYPQPTGRAATPAKPSPSPAATGAGSAAAGGCPSQ